MDIIGYRFQEVMYQQKSTRRELVIFTERELVRSIKTVLSFIVSVSLLSGEAVPTPGFFLFFWMYPIKKVRDK